MTEKLLLEIIIVLLACLFALLGWLFRQHAMQHQEVKQELEALKRQRETCSSSFATKGSLDRTHKRLDDIEEEHAGFGERLTRLECKENRT